jgi:hypothetical protein
MRFPVCSGDRKSHSAIGLGLSRVASVWHLLVCRLCARYDPRLEPRRNSEDDKTLATYKGTNMKLLIKAFVITGMGTNLLVFPMLSASSAEIACGGSICWHAKKKHRENPANPKATIQLDDWQLNRNERYSWREREDQEYWIQFGSYPWTDSHRH